VLELPRAVIDVKTPDGQDGQFVVSVGSQIQHGFAEFKSPSNRTLTITFDKGTNQIIVAGSQVAPEFGSVAAALLAVSMGSAVIVVRRFMGGNFRARP
jgi:hypothetical protein